MKQNRFWSVLPGLLLAASLLGGCAAQTGTGGNGTEGNGTTGAGGVITDDSTVTTAPVDTETHSYALVSQEDGRFSYRCEDCGGEAAVTVSCLSGTAGCVRAEGTTLIFSGMAEDSVYAIAGTLYGNLVVQGSAEFAFELELDGVTVTSADACPLLVSGAKKMTVSAKKETDNYLCDVRAEVTDADDIRAAIWADCDLDLQGKGNLYVSSVANNGVHTKDDLKVKNLSLQVECEDNALKGNDSVTVESGTLVLIARSGDGIKTTNSDLSAKGKQRGTVTISGGDIRIYAACDGIDAAYDVVVDESAAAVTLTVFTDQYSQYTTETTGTTNGTSDRTQTGSVTPVAFGGNSGNRQPGGGFGGGGAPGGNPGGGMSDGNSDKSDISTKGLKAANAIVISAGTVTVESYDDCIHANDDATLENGAAAAGNVTVSGGSLTLSSCDDAIHADGSLTVSGGTVRVLKSYEGLEGNTVTVSGGDVSVVSSDDGINGTATSGTGITVSGGTLYVLANGDGLDSNSRDSYGGILFSGGRSVIISTGRADSSIDTEAGYRYTGGYVAAIGLSGGMSAESTHCSPSVSTVGSSKTLSLTAGSSLTISGVVTVRIPSAMNALVICLGKTDASFIAGTSANAEVEWLVEA